MDREQKEVTESVLSRLNGLHRRIEGDQQAEDWFACVLSCFSVRLHDEFQRLNDPVTLLSARAWACRNLLELHVQVRFVLANTENAKRYYNDAWVDLVQLLDAFRDWVDILGERLGEHLTASGLVAQEATFKATLDESIAALRQEKLKDGVTRESYLSVQAMAGSVGMSDEFKHINKFTSKLIHPTAHSVLVAADWMPNVLPNIDMILVHAGGIHCVEALRLLETHVNTLGLFPHASAST